MNDVKIECGKMKHMNMKCDKNVQCLCTFSEATNNIVAFDHTRMCIDSLVLFIRDVEYHQSRKYSMKVKLNFEYNEEFI